MSSDSESSDQESSFDSKIKIEGLILGNYNIFYEIGRGGLSVVFLAYNVQNSNFYAIKIQDPEYYEEGIREVTFVKTLPTEPNCFNNLIEYFTKKINNNNYLCSVWNLHMCNLDNLLNSNKYTNGIPYDMVNIIMLKLINALEILHNKFKVIHGDIKPDNIFLKGINNRDKKCIEFYKKNYINEYSNLKKIKWIEQNKDLKNIGKMKNIDKLKIIKKVNLDILQKIKEELNDNYLDDFELTIDNLDISLADFGAYYNIDELSTTDETLGTRYYIAPEVILKGKLSYPIDIWALGCTYYELLFGMILFDPNKDKDYSRDYYHLGLIIDTCGNFCKNFIKSTKNYKEYFKKGKLINYSIEENRLERKLNELCHDNLDNIKILLKLLLTINPQERGTFDVIKGKFK